MTDKCWKLLIAIFTIVASQAVLFIGIFLGADAGIMGTISILGGMLGVVVGIIMGVGFIINSRGNRTLAG
jgi:hypothetical protein